MSHSDEERPAPVRAARNGPGTKADIRAIQEAATLPQGRFRLGTELAKLRDLLDGDELDVARDQGAVRSVTFEG